MTLQQLFDESYKTKIIARGRKERTVWEIQNTLNRWNDATDDIAIRAITGEVVNRFLVFLKSTKNRLGKPVSPNTIRKHLRNLKALLNHAKEKGQINSIPEIPMPKERLRNAKDQFTYEEIKSLIAATDTFVGETVNGMDAPAYWRALIVFVYSTACRIGTVMAARWDWIDGNTMEIASEFGVKTSYVAMLNEEALKVLGEMRQSHKESRIFPWPHDMRHLHRCLKKVVVAAGLPEDRQFGFHAIRKHTVTEIAKREGVEAASKFAGHSSVEMTHKYYVDAVRICEGVPETIRPLLEKTEKRTVAGRIMKFISRLWRRDTKEKRTA